MVENPHSAEFLTHLQELNQTNEEICYASTLANLLKLKFPNLRSSLIDLINMIVPFPYNSLNGGMFLSILHKFQTILGYKFKTLTLEQSIKAVQANDQIILGFFLYCSQLKKLASYFKKHNNRKSSIGLEELGKKGNDDRLCGQAVLVQNITEEGSLYCLNNWGPSWGDNGYFRINPSILKAVQSSVPNLFISIEVDNNISDQQRQSNLDQYRMQKNNDEDLIKKTLQLNKKTDEQLQQQQYTYPQYNNNTCPDCPCNMYQENHGQGNYFFQCQRCGFEFFDQSNSAYKCYKCQLYICNSCKTNKPLQLEGMQEELSKFPQIKCGKSCENVLITRTYQDSNWTCEQCKKDSKLKIRYRCQTCNWDCCYQCSIKYIA